MYIKRPWKFPFEYDMVLIDPVYALKLNTKQVSLFR